MSYSTFNITPSKGIVSNYKPRVIVSQFGDGYSQRVVDGINSIAKEWSLTFSSKDLSTAAQIVSFFEDRKGVEGFKWTPPDDTIAYSVICPEWTRTYDSHISATITAKFVQIFDVLV